MVSKEVEMSCALISFRCSLSSGPLLPDLSPPCVNPPGDELKGGKQMSHGKGQWWADSSRKGAQEVLPERLLGGTEQAGNLGNGWGKGSEAVAFPEALSILPGQISFHLPCLPTGSPDHRLHQLPVLNSGFTSTFCSIKVHTGERSQRGEQVLSCPELRKLWALRSQCGEATAALLGPPVVS